MNDTFDAVAYLAGKGKHGKAVSGGKEVAYACFMDCGRPDDDRKKKLYLDTEEGFYNCKVCNASGGSYLLQKFFGDTPDRPDPNTPDPAVRRQILNWSADVGHQLLLNNDDMLMYLLEERGLSMETIVERKLGWVGNRWSLTGNLPEQFTKAQLLTSGLVYKDGPRQGNDFFYNHLLIPYLHHGQVVQMRGKVLGAKYFTGPGEPVRVYSLDSLEGADDVIIAEGEYDAMALKQHLQSAPDERARRIAVIGLAGANGFKDENLPYLADAKRVFIGLDPDDTGRREAVKLKDMLGTRARILELPAQLPKADWSDYLLPVPAGAKSTWHLEHPHAGHDWRDVMSLLGTASGKRVFSISEAGHSWRNQRDDGAYITTGYVGLDETITGMKPGQVMIVLAKTGTGKAQASTEPVLTSTGWRPIGELAVGDEVFGQDGQLHNVTGVFPQGERELFTCTFSDGATVTCDKEHLWTYRTQGGARPPWQTATLDEIKDFKRVYVPVAAPVNFPARDLPIDPYLLGVLLGDGSLRGTTITLTTDDEIAQALPIPDGLRLVRWADNGPGVGEYRISGVKGKRNALMHEFELLGLRGTWSHTKFIPDIYMTASIEQRWALLQGLLDTDGSIDARHGTIEYSTSSSALAEGVQALGASLGGISKIVWRETTHRPAARLHPQLPPTLGNPFRLARKAINWRPRATELRRRLISVEPAGRADATCISVDAKDSLYITRGYVPTHNTVLLCNLAYNMREHKILFVSLEMTREEVYERMMKIYLFHHPTATDHEVEAELANVYICDENRLGERDLNDIVDEFEIESGERPGVLFVDYLGYYARGARGNTPYEKTTNAVMQLKAEAKAGRFVVISPSQVNRLAKEGAPIDLDDARDSGAIEETADFLLSIWRPDDALTEQVANAPQTGKIKMTVLKSRHGGKDKQFSLVMDLLTLALVDDKTREARRASEHNNLAWRGSKWADIRRAETTPFQHQLDDLRGLS